jgi:hypothetical protein
LKRTAIGVVLALAVVVVPGVAWGHSAGRVELLVTNLQFKAGGQGLVVGCDLIDRDSGASAAGFAVDVSARRGDGAQAGPVTLTDPRGRGHYEGVLTVAAGSWAVTARAGQGTSALPALGSTRTVDVKLAADGVVTQGRGHSGATDVATWIALAVMALAAAAGGVLVLTHKPGRPVPQAMGQRTT